MTISMTGFASGAGNFDGLDWACEIRSVNNKGLDIRLRLPDAFQPLEAAVRKQVAQKVARGSLQISFKLGKDSDDDAPRIDTEKLAWWLEQIATLQHQAKGAGVKVKAPTAVDLLTARPSVLVQTRSLDVAGWSTEITTAIETTLQYLVAMRRAEGTELAAVLHDQITQISDCVTLARDTLKHRATAHAAAFQNALQKLQTDVDPDRLYQEIAVLAVKSDVSEELDRLDAHVSAARDLLASDGPIGRKFEFLTQEFNREANTLCSKAAHIDLTRIGLDLKSVIDQMREQVLNVE